MQQDFNIMWSVLLEDLVHRLLDILPMHNYNPLVSYSVTAVCDDEVEGLPSIPPETVSIGLPLIVDKRIYVAVWYYQ